MSEELFVIATREKVRWDTIKGQLSVEQLWELPLTTNSTNGVCLDSVAIQTNRELQNATDSVSYIKKTSKSTELLQLKLDIVKYIIEVKLNEQAVKETAAVNRSKAAVIQQLINQKKADALGTKSIEELEKELAQLNT